MDSEVKEEIIIVVELLRASLVKNHVSIGISGRDILFFDTDHYVKTGNFSGFKISMDELVK